MTASSRLGTQLSEIVSTLSSAGASFALIGGLALAPHKVIRATQDIDLLMDATMADSVHDALLGLGYQCLHRSIDAANYLRGDERVDFIYAHRPAALRLLRNAFALQTDFGPLHVVSADGLKRDGFIHLFAADGGLPAVPVESERDPFLVLDELMVVVEALCPVWPDRPGFEASTHFLL